MTMKRKVLFVSAVALTLGLGSCSSVNKTYTNKVSNGHHVAEVMMPKYVDYDVDLSKKLSSTISGKIDKEKNQEYYVQQALAQCIASANADFLWEPVISKEVKGINVTVTVTGFAAKFVKTVNVDVKDTAQVKSFIMLNRVGAPIKAYKDNAPDAAVKKGLFGGLFKK